MYICLIAFFYVRLVEAEYHTFVWQSCTTNTDHQAIKVHSANVSPTPVQIPGPLYVSFTVFVLKQIELGTEIRFDVTRHSTLGYDIHVSCLFFPLERCTLDVCSIFEISANTANTTNTTRQIIKMFESVRVSTHCPVAIQHITIVDYRIDIPKLDGLAKYLVPGDYTVKATVLHQATGIELGCFRFSISLKEKPKDYGWLLGRKRRNNKNPN
ncbi:uncharacterized protein LOC134263570 [Saccostrea cucullata]|uniref:uncharacterized protein LOC134233544 n=1 Tax=Saccostrea cuccullata TaxID=36930 RepID=UPI002ED2D64E